MNIDYEKLEKFILSQLGEPDDVFNKYHLDMGELQHLFNAWYSIGGEDV